MGPFAPSGAGTHWLFQASHYELHQPAYLQLFKCCRVGHLASIVRYALIEPDRRQHRINAKGSVYRVSKMLR